MNMPWRESEIYSLEQLYTAYLNWTQTVSAPGPAEITPVAEMPAILESVGFKRITVDPKGTVRYMLPSTKKVKRALNFR